MARMPHAFLPRCRDGVRGVDHRPGRRAALPFASTRGTLGSWAVVRGPAESGCGHVDHLRGNVVGIVRHRSGDDPEWDRVSRRWRMACAQACDAGPSPVAAATHRDTDPAMSVRRAVEFTPGRDDDSPVFPDLPRRTCRLFVTTTQVMSRRARRRRRLCCNVTPRAITSFTGAILNARPAFRIVLSAHRLPVHDPGSCMRETGR